MSDRADRPLPLSSPSPPPTPWQQSWARARRGSPQQLQRARFRARARRQNLGGGGAGPRGARAWERAHAAVFFSHNPEAAAREGRGVGGRIWARKEKRAPFDGGLVALVGRRRAGCDAALRFWGRYSGSSREGGGGGWSAVVILCQGFPEARWKGCRAQETGGLGTHIQAPTPPGGEGGWRRGLRATEGWCLLGGKGRALPVVGEGLRAGEAPRVEAAPCPLAGGTCWAERGGRAWLPLGSPNVVSNVVFHLAHVGINSLRAAPLVWLLQELGNLDGLFVLLLQPPFPSSSSRCLFSAPPRPVQTFPAQAAARGCCRSRFSGFRLIPLWCVFWGGRLFLPSTMGFSSCAKMDFHWFLLTSSTFSDPFPRRIFVVVPLFKYIICKMENEIFTPLLEQFMTSPLVTWVSRVLFIVYFAALFVAAEMEMGVRVLMVVLF